MHDGIDFRCCINRARGIPEAFSKTIELVGAGETGCAKRNRQGGFEQQSVRVDCTGATVLEQWNNNRPELD